MRSTSTQSTARSSGDRGEAPLGEGRDLRIDFFRGVALLIVVVDHIEAWSHKSVIESWTLISLGFSDAAEIFVFLSGYVFATAYSKALDRGGFWACMKKALKRAFQIYVAYVLAAVTVIAIGASFIDWNPPPYVDDLRVGDRVADSLLAALSLRFHPIGFDILSMYVPVLPWMAVLLYVQRRATWLAWLMSGGVYLAVQVYPWLNFNRYGDSAPWYFNPLAWQFLFFLGVYLGDPQRARRAFVPRWLLVVLSAAMLAAGFFVLKGSLWLVRMSPTLWETFQPMYRLYWDWGDKTSLGPLRLLHFFALTYVTALLLPRGLRFWSSGLARPIVVAGQHSLEVYAFQLVASFVAVFLISARFGSTSDVVALDILACLASIGFAYVVRWWQGSKGQPRTARGVSAASKSGTSRRGGTKLRDKRP